MTMKTPGPYVGPQAFGASDILPAREVEVGELRDLLVVERIVLLHAPSGAGKTSLVEAQNGLRAALTRNNDFVVRPRCRVLEPLPESVTATIREKANRYVFSVLRSLQSGLAEEVSDEQLAAMDLPTWLDHHRVMAPVRPGRDPHPAREVLIFDQFEELLTTDPADERGRAEFLRQVAVALDAPHRWALFIIREDYLGALEPWARLLPTHLAQRYRIDLLDAEGAAVAIREPAEREDVQFDDDAIDWLVQSLLKVQVQGLTGRLETKVGVWVEPVQLQVVCQRLWEKRDPQDKRVERHEVELLGDVDAALATWYDDTVREIASKTQTPERQIRDWVINKLISSTGVRTQVLRGGGATEGLDNTVVQALETAHLIRGEDRQGCRWYELVHDRLVKPVRVANARWRKTNLQPFHLAAEGFARTMDEEWLLRGHALKEARRWALDHPADIRDIDLTLLEKSAASSRRRARERVAFGALVAFVVIAGALIGVQGIQNQRSKAALVVSEAAVSQTQQTLKEEVNRVKTTLWQRTAEKWSDEDPTRAVAALAEAATVSLQVTDIKEWQELAENLVAHSVARVTLYGHTDVVNEVTYSPDGRWILSVSEDGSGRAWSVDGSSKDAAFIQGDYPLRDIVTCGDSTNWWAAIASQDGSVTGFHGGDWSHPIPFSAGDGREDGDVATVVAFDANCDHLLAGHGSGLVERWRYVAEDAWAAETTWTAHTNGVTSINFSPDGHLVVTTARDRSARVWSLDEPSQTPQTLKGGGGVVYASAFGSGGRSLYLASYNAPIRRWSVSANGVVGQPQDLWRHNEGGRSVVTSSAQDELWVATSGFDDDVVLLSEDRAGSRVTLTPEGLPSQSRMLMTRVLFSPTGDRVFSYRADGGAHLWWTDERACSIEMRAARGRILSAAFSPDGSEVTTGYDDGTLYVWPANQAGHCASLYRDADGRRSKEATIKVARFSQDGKRLAVIDSAGHLSLLHWLDAGLLTPDAQMTYDGVALVALDEDGSHILLYRDGDPYLLLLAPAAPAIRLRLPTAAESLSALALSLDGQTAAFGDTAGKVWYMAVAQPDAVLELPQQHRKGLNVLSLAFDSSGRTLVSGGEDGRVVVSRLKGSPGGESSSPAPSGHIDYVNSLAFSRDGMLLLSASDDLTARIWDVTKAPVLVQKLARHMHYLRSARFDAAVERVVTTGLDPTVRIWNWRTGEALLKLTGHTDAVLDAAFLNQSILVTSSADGTARTWRIDQKVTLEDLRRLSSACAPLADRLAIVNATEESAARDLAACQAQRGGGGENGTHR